MEPEPCCKNCGALAPGKFCPECGQSTQVTVPTVLCFIHEALGALFSYDHKLWRTLVTLLTRPGQLTVDYVTGKRVRYLTPFQLFFWLQTVTFLAYRQFFNDQAGAADSISREILFIGGVVAVMLALIHVRRRHMRFLVHLVAAIHVWAFLMVFLLAEYSLTPFAVRALRELHWVHGVVDIGTFVTRSTELVLLFYMLRAIQVIYGSSLGKAVLKMMVLFVVYRVLSVLIPGL